MFDPDTYPELILSAARDRIRAMEQAQARSRARRARFRSLRDLGRRSGRGVDQDGL